MSLWPSNPVQWTGIVVFSLAAVACGRAASQKAAGAWPSLAVWQGLLAAEIWLESRYWLHDRMNGLLQAHGLYASRQEMQAALLLLVALAGLALCLWALRPGRPWPWRLARCATMLAVLCVVVETVSLHGIDRWLYAGFGPLPLLAWGWVGLALMVVVAAALAARRKV